MNKTRFLIFLFLFVLISQAQADTSTGLVSWWKFDEGTGTAAADLSGQGNHGTLIGGPTWVDGKQGKAISFDGVDDHVSDFPSAPPAFGTVAAWFRSTGNTGGDGYIVSHYKDGGAGERIYIYILASDGKLYARLDNTNVPGTAISSGVVANDKQWHHVVLVYGTAAEVTQSVAYVDGGAAVNVTDATATLSTVAVNLSIGENRFNTGTQLQLPFQGDIDDVRFYNRAFTSADASELYLLGLYRMIINNASIGNAVINL